MACFNNYHNGDSSYHPVSIDVSFMITDFSNSDITTFILKREQEYINNIQRLNGDLSSKPSSYVTFWKNIVSDYTYNKLSANPSLPMYIPYLCDTVNLHVRSSTLHSIENMINIVKPYVCKVQHTYYAPVERMLRYITTARVYDLIHKQENLGFYSGELLLEHLINQSIQQPINIRGPSDMFNMCNMMLLTTENQQFLIPNIDTQNYIKNKRSLHRHPYFNLQWDPMFNNTSYVLVQSRGLGMHVVFWDKLELQMLKDLSMLVSPGIDYTRHDEVAVQISMSAVKFHPAEILFRINESIRNHDACVITNICEDYLLHPFGKDRITQNNSLHQVISAMNDIVQYQVSIDQTLDMLSKYRTCGSNIINQSHTLNQNMNPPELEIISTDDPLMKFDSIMRQQHLCPNLQYYTSAPISDHNYSRFDENYGNRQIVRR